MQAWYNAINQQIDKEFACDHSNISLVCRVSSNGAKTFLRQCQRCGHKCSPIKRVELSQREANDAKPINESIELSWRDRANRRRQELYEQFRNNQGQAWWEAYNLYLQSPRWRKKREAVIARDVICQACRCRPAVQAHHLTYDHIGYEPLFELVGICVECHESLHNPSETEKNGFQMVVQSIMQKGISNAKCP